VLCPGKGLLPDRNLLIKPTKHMNFCPQCGSKREGNFCKDCGFKFTSEQPQDLVAPVSEAPVPPPMSSAIPQKTEVPQPVEVRSRRNDLIRKAIRTKAFLTYGEGGFKLKFMKLLGVVILLMPVFVFMNGKTPTVSGMLVAIPLGAFLFYYGGMITRTQRKEADAVEALLKADPMVGMVAEEKHVRKGRALVKVFFGYKVTIDGNGVLELPIEAISEADSLLEHEEILGILNERP
jgi:hypothetical protein